MSPFDRTKLYETQLHQMEHKRFSTSVTIKNVVRQVRMDGRMVISAMVGDGAGVSMGEGMESYNSSCKTLPEWCHLRKPTGKAELVSHVNG